MVLSFRCSILTIAKALPEVLSFLWVYENNGCRPVCTNWGMLTFSSDDMLSGSSHITAVKPALQSLHTYFIQLNTYTIADVEDTSYFRLCFVMYLMVRGQMGCLFFVFFFSVFVLQLCFRLHTIVHLYAFADTPCDRKLNLPEWRHTVAPAGCCSALSVHHEIEPAQGCFICCCW